MARDTTAGGVKSVQTALDVLEVVAASPEELGVTEIAEALELAKPSIFRHLKTLSERGFLQQNPRTLRYGLGVRLHILGQAAANKIDLLSVSEPIMAHLREEAAMTVNLAGFQPHGTVILRSLLGPAAMEFSVRVGTEFPYHATSQGIIALAFRRQPPLAMLRRQKLEKFTEFTVTDPEVLENEIYAARENGWALAIQRTLLGTYAISVPVFDSTGECIAALTLIGTMRHVVDSPDLASLSVLMQSGLRMSLQLGFSGNYPRLKGAV